MFRDGLARVIYVVAATLLILAVTMMTVQVGLRTFFSSPMAWAEEVVRYAFVWVVYLGSVLAVLRDSHIRVTVATDPFGRPGRLLSNAVSRFVNIVCFAYLAWWGWDLAMKYRGQEFYTLPGVPQLVFYMALPLCCAIATLFLLMPNGVKPAAEHDGRGDV